MCFGQAYDIPTGQPGQEVLSINAHARNQRNWGKDSIGGRWERLSSSSWRDKIYNWLEWRDANLCRVEFLLELDAEFFTDAFEGVDVLLVLVFVLDLLLDALKDANGGRVVVDTTAGTERRLDHFGRRNKVVSKAVVQTALQLEQVLNRVEEADVARVEGFKRLLLVVCGVASDCKVQASGEDSDRKW